MYKLTDYLYNGLLYLNNMSRPRHKAPHDKSYDLGRGKKRQCRRWFSRTYYASVMRPKELFEENVVETFASAMNDFARRVNSSLQRASNSKYDVPLRHGRRPRTH